MLPAVVLGTPSAATWHREQLLGENAEYFFVLLSQRTQQGTYYAYSEALTLQKVAKAGLDVADEWVLRSTHHEMDQGPGAWGRKELDTTAVDVASILRDEAVHLAFSATWPLDLEIDGTGVHVVADGARIRVVTRAELDRQVPDLGREPRIVALSVTSARPPDLYFYSVQSNTPAGDDDWSEDLLVVPQASVRAALESFRQAPTLPQADD